jgi:uncharacterized membrane protein
MRMGFVDDSVVVRVDIQDVYSLWLDYEGYPRFMSAVDRVAVVGYSRLRWTGRVCGAVLEWESDVVAHVEDTRVRWHAADGRETGEVTFEKLDAGETRVHYQLEYEPAAWGLDEAGLRHCLHARVHDDLRAFKMLAEDLQAASA